MTTDKALEILEMSEQARWKDGYEGKDVEEAVKTIREALKQGNVLDKIKVEIEMMNSSAYMGEYNVGLRDALKVINKYKAGSEG